MMPAPCNLLGDLGNFPELQGIPRARSLPEAVPCGHSVVLDFACFHRRFQKRERLADTVQKLFLRNFRELRLGIMEVVDVHTLNTQIFQTAADLVFKKFRRHAMAARRDIFCAENSGLNVFTEKIFVGVGGHRTVRRQVAALCAYHDFVSFKTLRGKLPDGRGDTSFAALKPVVDGGVDYIDAALDRRDGRGCVAFIRFCIRLTEVRADPERREQESLRFAKMASGGTASEFLRVARRSFFGGGSSQNAPSARPDGTAARFVFASVELGASSR